MKFEMGTQGYAIVTLVVIYDNQPPQNVRIQMSREYARRAITLAQEGTSASRSFSGYDVNGDPFKIEVGNKALAVYIETESNSS